jgi:hypothetical protein
MIRKIGTRVFAAEVLVGLKKADLAGIDLPAAKCMTRQALTAVAEHRISPTVRTIAGTEWRRGS